MAETPVALSASSGETLLPRTGRAETTELYHNDTSGGDLTVMDKADLSEPILSWHQKVKAELKVRFIDGFTPVYFASVMGTGMSANLLYNFPYAAHWIQICGIIMGLVSLVIFVFLVTFFALALCYRPSLFSQIHRDPAKAPAMGCFVMGYTTLITFLHGVLGRRAIVGIWALWWIVVFGSLYTCIVTFFFSLMTKHRKSQNFTAHTGLSMQYLLPVVTMTVAAALGGLISPDMPSAKLEIITMTVSLVIWAIAMLLASIITTINFWRMFIHKIPHTGQVLTLFLPIGFVGQGAFAILLFGQNSTLLLMKHHAVVEESLYVSFLSEAAAKNKVALTGLPAMLSVAILVACSLVAFMLISFGFLLTIYAYMALMSKMAPFAVKKNHEFLYQTSSGLRFKGMFVGLLRFQRGFWSMTFPLGTMALATHQFYKTYNGFGAFRVISAIYAMLVIVTTLGCLMGVAYRGIAIFSRALRSEEKAENVGSV